MSSLGPDDAGRFRVSFHPDEQAIATRLLDEAGSNARAMVEEVCDAIGIPTTEWWTLSSLKVVVRTIAVSRVAAKIRDREQLSWDRSVTAASIRLQVNDEAHARFVRRCRENTAATL